MDLKTYRLIKGIFSEESLNNDEIKLIRVDTQQWNESIVSATHFVKPVPYSKTGLNKMPSFMNEKM